MTAHCPLCRGLVIGEAPAPGAAIVMPGVPAEQPAANEDREREALIRAIQYHINPANQACPANPSAVSHRFLAFINNIGVYQRFKLFELMDAEPSPNFVDEDRKKLADRRERWRRQLAAQFLRLERRQIDFGAHRFAEEAARTARESFLESALNQATKTFQRVTEEMRRDFEQAADAYRSTYYNSMIDAYRVGAIEAGKMMAGDFSPEPWVDTSMLPVDRTWSPEGLAEQ